MSLALSQINTMPPGEFVRIMGQIFEDSLWIAERVVDQRPFSSLKELRTALFKVVSGGTSNEQVALIRAHPDLAGRAILTTESKGEQASAGLDALSADDVSRFDRYNRQYKERFGFPFVICARLNDKDAILNAFSERLLNSPDSERERALVEIEKIASLRLADLVTE